MTFPAHFGENCVIPLQTVAELWCIKLCAVFFWTTLYKRDDMQNNSVITMNKKTEHLDNPIRKLQTFEEQCVFVPSCSFIEKHDTVKFAAL